MLSCPDYSITVCQAALLELIMIIAMIGAFLLFVNNCIKPCNSKDTRWLQDKIDAVVESVFDKILTKHGIQGERKVYEVLRYKAPLIYNNLLLVTFVFLIISAIAEFWSNFLFEESSTCTNDEYTCCYDANQIYPQRLDCSNTSYLKTNNITEIICYKFAFRLGTATGSAIGLVTSIILGLFIVTWCLLKISKGTRATAWRIAFTILFQMYAVVVVAVFTWLMLHYRITTHGGASSYGLLGKNIMIAFVGIILFNYIVFFLWWKCEKIKEYEEYKNIQNDTNP